MEQNAEELVTIYTPDGPQGGLIWGIKRGSREVYASRYIIFQLFRRDFVAQFRQKIFGYLWALLSPLLGVISFIFLYVAGVLKPGDGDMPYTIYVLIGTNIWACLPGALGAVSGGLQAQADLIMRTGIPKMALAISSLASLTYSIIISMITTLGIFLLMGVVPTWWFFLYPLLVLPMVLLGVAIGLVLSVIGSIAKDLTPLFSQGLSLMMYITPIIYVRSSIENEVLKRLIDLNPLTYLVDVPRELIFGGVTENAELYLLISACIMLVSIIGIRIFYLLEDLVAERL